MDSRDDFTEERIRQVNDQYKLYRCHTIMNWCAAAYDKVAAGWLILLQSWQCVLWCAHVRSAHWC